MGVERVIHVAVFTFLLVGLFTLSIWAVLTYLPPQNNIILSVAVLPLSWGIILLAMYIAFGRLGWKWWK